MPFDVVTFGEAMVRLSPPQFRRLEQAQTLEVQVGGAELNTAVGVARLGHSAAWVSRLTRNPLGRFIANKAREAGVIPVTWNHFAPANTLPHGTIPGRTAAIAEPLRS